MTAGTPSSASETYGVANTAITVSVTAFTPDVSNCAVTYSLLDTSNNVADISVFTYAVSSGVGTLTISTSDTSKVGTYNLKVRAAYTLSAVTSDTATITVVIDICTGTTIISATVPTVSRDLVESYPYTIQTLAWTQTKSQCTTAITY